MPRLTFNDYLNQRAFLRLAWEEFDQLYSLLAPDQQWALHRYYQPITGDSEEFLKRYRASITKKEPSLPARAGRLYAQLHRVYEASVEAAKAKPAPPRERLKSASRKVRVRAVVRPEPDAQKLARALLEVAKQMADQNGRR